MPLKDPVKQKEYLKQYFLNRKQKGLCRNCGENSPVTGQTYCLDCKKRTRERGIMKLCPQCELHRTTKEKCYHCRKKEYIQGLLDNGICVRCGLDPMVERIFCAKCVEIVDR